MPRHSQPWVFRVNPLPHLSNEIWSQIFSHVQDVSDLKNIRPVSSTIGDLAAVPLFHTIYAAFYPKYLRRLNDIASYSHLRSCVRELRFDGNLLEDDLLDYSCWIKWVSYSSVEHEVDRAVWKIAYKEKDKDLLYTHCATVRFDHVDGHPTFEKAMRKHHSRLIRLSNSQKKLLRRALLTKTFLAAAQKFTGLRSVKIGARGGAQGLQSSPRDLRIDDWFESPPSLRALTKLDEQSMAENYEYDLDDPDLVKPLVFCLESIAEHLSIRDFSCYDVPWSFWHRHIGAYDWNAIDVNTTNALRNLRSLNLHLQSGNWGDFGKGSPGWNLWSFLQSASEVETLSLDFRGYSGLHNALEPFVFTFKYGLTFTYFRTLSPLFERLRLPRLHTLQLGRCEFSQEALVGFINAHASTLKDLGLFTVRLSQSTPGKSLWKRALLAAAPLSDLESLALGYLMDQELCWWGDPDSDASVPDQPPQLMRRAALSMGKKGSSSWRMSVRKGRFDA